jgi:hypothetical protein
MKPANPSRHNLAHKKSVQSVKPSVREKVWVNPKSHFKNICEQAWRRAGAPSPKFIDMGQIDMRKKKLPERAKRKAVTTPKSGTSTKSRRSHRES